MQPLTNKNLPFVFSWALALAAISLFSVSARAGDEIIVRYRLGAAPLAIARAKREAGLRLKEHVQTQAMPKNKHPGLDLVESSLGMAAALAMLRSDPAVEFAEPNYILHTSSVSDDTRFVSGELWGMYGDTSSPSNSYGSQAAEAWAAGYTGSTNVFVAVLDDGVQITHPDLAANIWVNPEEVADGLDNDGNGLVDDFNGWNFAATNNAVFQAGDYHGTHVAGIIGAEGGNGADVAGVNWHVTLIPVKFIHNRNGTTLNAVKAIDYCIALKARHNINLIAMNASWGASGYSAALHEAIIRAANAGILFIVASGNETVSTDEVFYTPSNIDTSVGIISQLPSGYNSVLSVAAINDIGELSWFSNFGAKTVHLGAPGEVIYSTFPVDTTDDLDGTSMAAPHVTGAVALYASTHPDATPAQIRAAILESVQPTPSLAGKTTTGGRLDLSNIIAPSPKLAAVSAVVISESVTNGVIDPGETVTVRLTVTNITTTATTGLEGTLLATGGVLNPTGAQNFGVLSAGGNAVSGDFAFEVNGTCGEDLILTLNLTDNGAGAGSLAFRLKLGAEAVLFSADLSTVTPPALPSGWTALPVGGGLKWKTVSSAGRTAFFAPNPPTFLDTLLTSPSVHVRSGSAMLSFEHSFVLEPDWDGGVLEISIAGAPFIDIQTAGGKFLTNGYNWHLNNSTTPLLSRWAWSGNSGTALVTRVQLPSSCFDQNVQFRFRCGSDTAVGGAGWFIYSMQVVDGYLCSLPDVETAEDASPATVPFSIGNAAGQTGLTVTASSSNSTLLPAEDISINGAGSALEAVLTPATNEFGASAVTLKIQSTVATTYRTFNLTVTNVNDAPSFDSGPDTTVPQDSGPYSLVTWASNILSGPSNEAAQLLDFVVTNDTPQLFAVAPALNASGTLSFTPTLHARGVAVVTVKLHDDGGTGLGGQDTSPAESFSITIGQTTDSDGDGLPDDYETAFGFALNSPDDTADQDGDGATNYAEYLAGTDPTNPRSTLRVTQVEPGTVRISSVAGKSYSLDERTSLTAGSWLAVVDHQNGTGAEMNLPDLQVLSNELQKFYRVTTQGENGTSVSSEEAGFIRLNLLGNSDTYVSMPFSRPAATFGSVLGAVDNTVQVSGAPGWADGEWVYEAGTQTNTYYLLVRSGALEGEYFTITTNTSDTLTVEAEVTELAGLVAGDALAIVPYWTLGSIFPAGSGIHESTSPAVRLTEVLLPNVENDGVNLSASGSYYYLQGAWRRAGLGMSDRNDDVVLPDMYFIVRHNNATSSLLTAAGSVESRKLRAPIRRQAGGKQDNSLALRRPAALSLNESGLVESGAFRASSSATIRLDELFFFSNGSDGHNKPASAAYYYLNGNWRKIGGAGSNVGADSVFAPGNAFILRSGVGSSSADWENSPNY